MRAITGIFMLSVCAAGALADVTVTPVTTPATPHTQPAPQPIKNATEFAKAIPAAFVPASGKWTPLQVDAVNTELAKLKHRDVSLMLTASTLSVQKLDQPAERCSFAFIPNPTVLGRLTVAPVVYVPDSLKAEFATINPNDVVRVNASISNVTLWSVNPSMIVKVELVDPVLKTAGRPDARIAATQPVALNNEPAITDLADIIRGVPDSLVPTGDWNTIKLEEANAALAKFAGRSAELTVTVAGADRESDGKYVLTASLMKVGRVLVRQRVIFPESMELELAALNVKDTRLVKATVKTAYLKELDAPARGRIGLVVELANPTLELPGAHAGAAAKASIQPPAAPATIKEVSELFKAIPAGIVPPNRSDWTWLKSHAANGQLQKLRGAEINLALTLASIAGGEPVGPDRKNPFILTAKPLESGRFKITAKLVVQDDMKRKFVAVTPGSTMRTTAAIEEIQLDNDAVSRTLKPTAVEK
jgi:hypothetical protein